MSDGVYSIPDAFNKEVRHVQGRTNRSRNRSKRWMKVAEFTSESKAKAALENYDQMGYDAKMEKHGFYWCVYRLR